MSLEAIRRGACSALLCVLLSACPPPEDTPDGGVDGPVTPADDPALPARGYYLGLLPTPSAGGDLGATYGEVSPYVDFVPVWGRPTPFYELAADLGGQWGDGFVEALIRGNDMFPLVHLSFLGPDVSLAMPPDLSGSTLADPTWRAAYKQAALDVARAARPRYLSLGNEVNRWYERHGTQPGDDDGFQHWVSLYQETYDAVKAIAPDTLVFCVFAREVVIENRAADMAVLDLFDATRLDLLVLTSYPHAVQGINTPAQIPGDYYSAVAARLPDVPFGFSEVTWPSMAVFGGEAAQSEFLTQLIGPLTRDQGVDLRLLGWPWLTDLDATDDVGLIEHDGTEKQAYQVWRGL